MDKRKRNYYLVQFSWQSKDMRMRFIKIISPKIKFHHRGNELLISCPKEDSEAVEYELRKAERNDDFCKWRIGDGLDF